jgi:hypothetical protein
MLRSVFQLVVTTALEDGVIRSSVWFSPPDEFVATKLWEVGEKDIGAQVQAAHSEMVRRWTTEREREEEEETCSGSDS